MKKRSGQNKRPKSEAAAKKVKRTGGRGDRGKELFKQTDCNASGPESPQAHQA